MLEIKDLLERFRGLLAGEDYKKEVIQKILQETIGLALKKEDINIKNGTLYLNISPLYKNEILIKKEFIYERLKQELGSKSPQDIR